MDRFLLSATLRNSLQLSAEMHPALYLGYSSVLCGFAIDDPPATWGAGAQDIAERATRGGPQGESNGCKFESVEQFSFFSFHR